MTKKAFIMSFAAQVQERLAAGEKTNDIARWFQEEHGINWKTAKEVINNCIKDVDLSTSTQTNDYKTQYHPTSIHPEKKHMMDIEEYCEYYKLPYKDVSSYKLVQHTGAPFYNIVFREKVITDDFPYFEEMDKILKKLKKHKKVKFKKLPRTGVATVTDIHFGAYVLAMKNTPEFSVEVLIDMLHNAADHINRQKFDKVHVHCLGDIIETFTGLNHKNSWKGIAYGMFGVKAVTKFVEVFHEHFLSRIENLDKIKIVAGNHDRVTSSKDEDTEGGAAYLAAWGLERTGYDVEFSPRVLTHVVGNICYILNHGHLGLTRMTTKDMCWDYGVQGKFNFVMEGHLHSRIQKLSANQIKNFKQVDDDTINCRRQVCPSMFTGNTYSEQEGYSTTAGFLITEESATGKPIVHDYPLS